MSGYPTFFFDTQSQTPVFEIPQLGAAQQHPRHPHHHHHHHHHQARASPFEGRRASPPNVHSTSVGNDNDLDAQERQLVAQLEALRARKAQAHAQASALAEKQRRDEAQAKLYQDMQRRIALERQQQQHHERLEAERAYRQQVQEARQIAAARAIQEARRQAAEIELAQARERRARQIQAQQQYFAQHQRAQEERQRQIKQREEEQRRLVEAQLARQRQAREHAFWEQFESACAPAPSRRIPTPSASVHPKVPAQARPKAEPKPQQDEQQQEDSMAGFPIDILKMIFGPDVVVSQQRQQPAEQPTENQPQRGSATGSTSATPAHAPKEETKTAIPAPTTTENKPTEADAAQQFIDDLFGAFSSAFGLNDDDDDEKEDERNETQATQADPSDNKEEHNVANAQSAVDTQTETAQPEPDAPSSTPAEPVGPETETATGNVDDEVPVSAADLEAEKAQATADLIQAKYRQHLLRVTRLEKLEALESKLEKLDEGWTFPDSLDFLPEAADHHRPKVDALADPVDSASSQSEDLIVPPLAFTPTNVPYHAHAQALLGLLVAADAISSDGDEQVRNARREFVRLVEGKLGEMEIGRRRVWEKVKGRQQLQQETREDAHTDAKDAGEQQAEPSEGPTRTEIPEERTAEAIPVAVPSPDPLPTSTSDTPEQTQLRASATDVTGSNSEATAEIESDRTLEDVKAVTGQEEAATGPTFSDSEDEAGDDQKAEDEEEQKKEQVEEFVVV